MIFLCKLFSGIIFFNPWFVLNIWFFFFFSFLAALRHMEFPGQGSNLSRTVTQAAVVAMLDPLTLCAGPEIKPVSQCYRDTIDPIAPQQELLHIWFLKRYLLCLEECY